MCDTYQVFKIRIQGVRSLSYPVCSILLFVINATNVDVVVFSSCFARLTHRPVIDKTAAPQTVPCYPLSLAAASSRNLQLEIEDRFFGHSKRRKNHWLL
jgi:hypothetical protein